MVVLKSLEEIDQTIDRWMNFIAMTGQRFQDLYWLKEVENFERHQLDIRPLVMHRTFTDRFNHVHIFVRNEEPFFQFILRGNANYRSEILEDSEYVLERVRFHENNYEVMVYGTFQQNDNRPEE